MSFFNMIPEPFIRIQFQTMLTCLQKKKKKLFRNNYTENINTNIE